MDAAGSRHYPDKPVKVYLFGTCLIDLFWPQAGLDAVRLLEREGIEVIYPADQTCCGQPAHSSGFPEQSRAVALAQLALFPEPWPVVVPSGSCAGMMRQHYPDLFADDAQLLAQARALAERVFELSEFLVHVARVRLTDLGPATRVAVHTSCAARRQMGTHAHAGTLLAQLSRVEVAVHEHEAECCGFGGTFSLKHPAISAAMAADKVEAIAQTGADTLLSADCGCLLNLTHTIEKEGRRLPGEHLASFLWQRTAGEGGKA